MKKKKLLKFDHEKEDQESVLGISSSDEEIDDNLDQLDDDYLSDGDEFGNVHEIRAKKQEMDSDLDDVDEDDIPNVGAWGNKARKYFGTDYVDKDGAGITEKDRQIAEAEEEEGIAAQKRLIDELNESALDFDCFQLAEQSKDKLVLNDEDEIKNFELLNEKEKEDFLRRQSPEFFIFKQDYEHYLNESENKFKRIINLCEEKKYESFKKSDLFKFIAAKDELNQRYCMNIAFYMLLKTKGIYVKSHPIRSTLNLYRKLVKQTDEYLESIDLSNLDVSIDVLKDKNGDFFNPMNNSNNKNIDDSKQNRKRKDDSSTTVKKPAKKKVKFEDECHSEDDLQLKKAIKKKINNSKTIDQQIKDQSINPKDLIEEQPDEEFYSDEEQDEKEVLFVHKRDDVKKRRITKMIQKNKGLTPYRKRDYRNPRVRYKSKYKKAEIIRKSQVKEPVKEIKRYSGEYHGINASVVRSVRFK